MLKTKVECLFREKSKDAEGALCESCKHNELRSYYEPYYPQWTPTTGDYTITCGADTSISADSGGSEGTTNFYSQS